MAYKKNQYRRYNTKKIVVKPKQIWTLGRGTGAGKVLGIKKPSGTTGWESERVTNYSTISLVKAADDTINLSAPVIKIKHLKCEVTRSYQDTDSDMVRTIAKMKAYLLYLPQGVEFSQKNVTCGISETIANHPEWVLAEKTLNVNYTSPTWNNTTAKVTSKLAKNLRSGDQIILVVGTTYYSALVGDKDFTGKYIPYNCEWTFAQTR